MLFNDYCKNFESKSSKLKKLSNIIDDLTKILDSKENFFEYAFRNSYLDLISPNISSQNSNCTGLISYSKRHMDHLKQMLISIDFVEFGTILFEFKSIEDSHDYFHTDEVFNKMMDSYKVIHNFIKLTNKSDIYTEYFNCISAIKNMIDIYNKYIYLSKSIEDINNILYKNIPNEGLEIQLLMSDFHKETYNAVVDPIYDIYNKLCEIANVKEDIVIARIETGSFFAKFSGNLAILNLTAKIISSAHDIFIRNYTREGKKKNVAESVDLFGKQVEIMKTLKELGFNVDEHEEVANETLGLLLKKSNILLSSSPDIRINDKIISRSNEVKELLAQKELKQLAITIDNDLVE